MEICLQTGVSKRLFVAIPIPLKVADQLLRRVPHVAGLRPLSLRNLHLTLCFIGNSDPAPYISALQKVQAEPFDLKFDQLGSFGIAGRGYSLWIGVHPEPALLSLQTGVAEALQPLMAPARNATTDTATDIATEIATGKRTFRPHVTLARCGRNASERPIQDFFTQHQPDPPPFMVDHFCLYSSMLSAAGSSYFREHSFALTQGDQGKKGHRG